MRGDKVKWVVPKDINGVPILPDCVVVCHYPDKRIYGRIDLIDSIYLNEMFKSSTAGKKNLRTDMWVEVIDSDIPVINELVELLGKHKPKNRSTR